MTRQEELQEFADKLNALTKLYDVAIRPEMTIGIVDLKPKVETPTEETVTETKEDEGSQPE